MKVFLVVLALVSLCGCTRPDNAREVLEAQGYTDITITGYKFFGCASKEDFFRTGFVATSPNGTRVEGVVCEGLLKGATVRIKEVKR